MMDLIFREVGSGTLRDTELCSAAYTLKLKSVVCNPSKSVTISLNYESFFHIASTLPQKALFEFLNMLGLSHDPPSSSALPTVFIDNPLPNSREAYSKVCTP